MATASYIAIQEDHIIQAHQAVKKAREAFRLEQENNEGGRYRENADFWGTLKINAIVLRHEIERLLEDMST